MKIFLDAGHNYSGFDTGASGNGLFEQNVTFLIAQGLKKLLKKDGYDVYMSRDEITDNVGSTLAESLKKRADMSNEWGADLFISIHANAGGGKGTETLVYSKASKSYSVAEDVQNAVVKRLKTNDRGIKERPDLYVLSHTKAPAIIIETAFIDNLDDAKKLKKSYDEFAKAIYEGITGNKTKGDLTEVNDIVWELENRNIITDKALWTEKLNEDKNAYHLARKTVAFLRERGV